MLGLGVEGQRFDERSTRVCPSSILCRFAGASHISWKAGAQLAGMSSLSANAHIYSLRKRTRTTGLTIVRQTFKPSFYNKLAQHYEVPTSSVSEYQWRWRFYWCSQRDRSAPLPDMLNTGGGLLWSENGSAADAAGGAAVAACRSGVLAAPPPRPAQPTGRYLIVTKFTSTAARARATLPWQVQLAAAFGIVSDTGIPSLADTLSNSRITLGAMTVCQRYIHRTHHQLKTATARCWRRRGRPVPKTPSHVPAPSRAPTSALRALPCRTARAHQLARCIPKTLAVAKAVAAPQRLGQGSKQGDSRSHSGRCCCDV